MDEMLKKQLQDHLTLCEKVLNRHIRELVAFYEDEIEPIAALLKDRVSEEVSNLICTIEDIRDSSLEEEE